jgi:hypothetical protein
MKVRAMFRIFTSKRSRPNRYKMAGAMLGHSWLESMSNISNALANNLYLLYHILMNKSEFPRNQISSEEAKNVELSRNPFTRIRQLSELGAGFCTIDSDKCPLPLFLTRGDLIRVATYYESARDKLNIVDFTE